MGDLSAAKIVGRARLSLSQRLPNKPVKRVVRGIPMTLPRRHALPYFARPGTPYGENLIELGRGIAAAEGAVTLLDVGANVGDTALMVLENAPGVAVCVEPDPEWREYLNANLGSLPNVAIEPSVLLGPGEKSGSSFEVVHHHTGSSQVQETASGGVPSITTGELLARHPELANVRLIKSDTDGYDVMLLPALLGTFEPSRPIVFFELELRCTALATPEINVDDVWDVILSHGYEHSVVWDNGGAFLGAWPVSELKERSQILKLSKEERGYGFWDIALAHKDDPVGRKVLESFHA